MQDLMKKSIILIVMLINMIDGWSQCYPDRHSTNWFDGWVSCQAFPSPNPALGISHWIMYDFGQVYAFNQTHVWNVNDPDNLDRGMKEVRIDYSNDGDQWMEAGTFTFERANGTSTYEGFQGPDLQGIRARYLLLTGVENYGGACFGMSEIRFEAEDVSVTDVHDLAINDDCFSIQAYPNPFVTKSRLLIQSHCDQEINYKISDLLGRTISSGVVGQFAGFHTLEIDGKTLPAGNYVVSVNQKGHFAQQHLIKIE